MTVVLLVEWFTESLWTCVSWWESDMPLVGIGKWLLNRKVNVHSELLLIATFFDDFLIETDRKALLWIGTLFRKDFREKYRRANAEEEKER